MGEGRSRIHRDQGESQKPVATTVSTGSPDADLRITNAQSQRRLQQTYYRRPPKHSSRHPALPRRRYQSYDVARGSRNPALASAKRYTYQLKQRCLPGTIRPDDSCPTWSEMNVQFFEEWRLHRVVSEAHTINSQVFGHLSSRTVPWAHKKTALHGPEKKATLVGDCRVN